MRLTAAQRKEMLTKACATIFARVQSLSDTDKDVPSASSDEWLHTYQSDLVAYVRQQLGSEIFTSRQIVLSWCRVRKNKELQQPKENDEDHGVPQ